MANFTFIWDDQDNVAHLDEHGVIPAEAEYVIEHAAAQNHAISRTTGNPIAFGFTAKRRHLAGVYWIVDEKEKLVYVITAFDATPQTGPTKSRS